MASYAPAGGVLLLIGSTAAVVSEDLILIVCAGVLVVLAYAAGVAWVRSNIADGQGS